VVVFSHAIINAAITALSLISSAGYNHYRAAVLKFLYDRQRNPESVSTDGAPVNVGDSSKDKKLQVVSSSAAA